MLTYGRRRRAGLGVLAWLMLAEAALSALLPWPMKVLVDNVLGTEPLPAPLSSITEGWGTWGLIGAAVLCVVCVHGAVSLLNVAQAGLNTSVGQRLSYDLAADVYAQLQGLSLRSHARRSIGDLMRRVTEDCTSITTILRDSLLPAAAAVVTIAIAAGMMLALNVKLTLLAAIAVPALALIVRRYTPAIYDRGYEYAQSEADIWDDAERSLVAAPMLQAFTAEPLAEARISRTYDRVLTSAVALTRAQFRLKVLSGAVASVAGAGMLIVGAHEVQSGRLTVGGLLVFLAYLAMLYAPLDTLSQSMSSGTQAAGAARRVREVLEEQQEVHDLPGAAALAIPPTKAAEVEFRCVTWGYEPGRAAINGVDLRLPAGRTVALVGPSGAGKSTLAAMIARLCDPWSGEVRVEGADVRDLTVRSVRDHVALVQQETYLFPMSVADNIAYGRPGATMDEVAAAAKAAGIHDHINSLPQRYQTVVGERGATLSGGERQRIAIARALLKNAPILILDEPTSALDAMTEASILEALRAARRGRTTLVIAHRLATVRHADRIIVMERGRIVASGTHEELVTAGGWYAEMCRLQLGEPATGGPAHG
ncbi:MAG TPA: ABC transporter ATP-binding protein [Phycisphaerales bacterium]|nr:ABC transporter ATP-binding protein [Phycisphaerales bacterium]